MAEPERVVERQCPIVTYILLAKKLIMEHDHIKTGRDFVALFAGVAKKFGI